MNLLLLVLVVVVGEPALSFNRDIRPLLAEKCFTCHGPDAAQRKADLRLDQRESALEVIEPGAPDDSELIRRVEHPRARHRMPPEESRLTLSREEKQTLRRWIAEGAGYQPHWAFEPLPDRVALPALRDREWPSDPIDAFVLARLEAEGLAPSPAASPARWLRRVTLDLTGLPPTPDEVDAFLIQPDAAARRHVVDRLLASPRHGERMAVPWLDLARYADSYGYQSDQLSPTWPYRDWVVRAFQQNLPYDDFLTAQLAGDLLPDATRDQRLATAFLRLHRMTNEGGSIEAEWRDEYVCDRSQTAGTVFLALSVECARCHDHKYDPLTQRDFYAFSAYFNSIDEWGMYHDSDRVPSPSLLLPTPEQEREGERLQEVVREWEARVREHEEPTRAAFQRWIRGAPGPIAAPEPAAFYPLDARTEDGKFLPDGFAADSCALVPGHAGQALQMNGDDPLDLPAAGLTFQPGDEFTVSLWLWLPTDLDDCVIAHRSGGTDVGYHGMELSVRDGRLFFGLIRFWPGNAIAVASAAGLPRERWVHVAACYDASCQAQGLRLFVDGVEDTIVLRDRLSKDPQHGATGLSVGQRFRDHGLRGGRVDEIRVDSTALTAAEVAALAAGEARPLASLPVDQRQEHFRRRLAGPLQQATAALHKARAEWLSWQTSLQEISVMEELPAPRPTYCLPRGAYDSPVSASDRVERHPPGFLTRTPVAAHDRLGLARWMTRPDHPLTARVAVNRIWELFFGLGLVRSSDNFGIQGELPSHPELLDHLARSLVESGWDMQEIYRRIVLSATYGQDSAGAVLAQDPDNRLLARGPRRRLPAEMIRDTALFAAGLLDEERGGPPVSPYQPPGLWRENNSMSPAYQQSVGKNLYRRSLYTVWKRTAPMPNMLAFDAPSRELCSGRRPQTLVPLQALVLLNDVQFVEAARVLAERSLQESGGEVARAVELVFRRLTGRPADAEQRPLLELLEGLARQQADHYQAHPEEAVALRQVGESPPDESLTPSACAALTMVAQAVMNSDATLWKR